jgi:hypothetical protein
VRRIQFRNRVYANWLRKAAQQPSSAKWVITTSTCQQQHGNHNVRLPSGIASSSHILKQRGLRSSSCVWMGLYTIQVRLPLPLPACALDSRYLTLGVLRYWEYH